MTAHLTRSSKSLRAIALFEASKGLLTILAGFEILTFLHRDAEAVAAILIRHFHINPEGTYPALFLQYASHVNDVRIWAVFLIGLLYAAVRFIEAFGLWHERPWAEWFGAVAGGIYIPFELYELYLGWNGLKIAVLAINLLVVLILTLNIRTRHLAYHLSRGK